MARAIRCAWQPSADAEDRRFVRGMVAALGALIGTDVLLTAAAVRASGWRRLPWAAIALLACLFTPRTVTVGALVTTVVHTAEGAPPASEPRPS